MHRKSSISVGIILDSKMINCWIAKLISEIITSEFLNLSLIVLINNKGFEQVNKKFSPFKIRIPSINNILYNSYSYLDYKHYSNYVKKDALKKTNVDQLINKSEKFIYLDDFESGFSYTDINQIKEENLDVILDLNQLVISGEILNSAKYGVWSYISDNGSPVAFWEMYKKFIPFTMSVVRLKNPPENHEILFKTTSSMSFESLYFNRNFMYWKLSAAFLRKLLSLYKNEYSVAKENLVIENNYSKRNKIPNNIEMISFLTKLILHKVKSRFIREQWYLAYRNNKSTVSGDFTILKTSLDRFYADPFIVKKENKNYIFFEDYVYSEGKGTISFVELDYEEGSISKPIKVLDKPYHLSYPFLIEDKGSIYMIPETSENKTIELYKATSFPLKWQLEKVIMDKVNAVDSTVLFYKEKYWLFANIFEDGASSLDELHLFFSDSLFGEWVPHPMNPIVSDSRTARPAGNIYIKDGKLIRPSQNCQFSYGHSINLNEIQILDEKEYREKKLDEISPNVIKNNKGTHTYVFNDDVELIDCRKPVFKI